MQKAMTSAITLAIAILAGFVVWFIVMWVVFGLICGFVGLVWPIQFASSEGPRTLCLWARWVLSVGAGVAVFMAALIYLPHILRLLKGGE